MDDRFEALRLGGKDEMPWEGVEFGIAHHLFMRTAGIAVGEAGPTDFVGRIHQVIASLRENVRAPWQDSLGTVRP